MVIPLRLKQDMHILGGGVWKFSQHDWEAWSKPLRPIHQKHHVFRPQTQPVAFTVTGQRVWPHSYTPVLTKHSRCCITLRNIYSLIFAFTVGQVLDFMGFEKSGKWLQEKSCKYLNICKIRHVSILKDKRVPWHTFLLEPPTLCPSSNLHSSKNLLVFVLNAFNSIICVVTYYSFHLAGCSDTCLTQPGYRPEHQKWWFLLVNTCWIKKRWLNEPPVLTYN